MAYVYNLKNYNVQKTILCLVLWLEGSTHASTLAWRIPWTEEPGWPWSLGLQRVGYN